MSYNNNNIGTNSDTSTSGFYHRQENPHGRGTTAKATITLIVELIFDGFHALNDRFSSVRQQYCKLKSRVSRLKTSAKNKLFSCFGRSSPVREDGGTGTQSISDRKVIVIPTGPDANPDMEQGNDREEDEENPLECSNLLSSIYGQIPEELMQSASNDEQSAPKPTYVELDDPVCEKARVVFRNVGLDAFQSLFEFYKISEHFSTFEEARKAMEKHSSLKDAFLGAVQFLGMPRMMGVNAPIANNKKQLDDRVKSISKWLKGGEEEKKIDFSQLKGSQKEAFDALQADFRGQMDDLEVLMRVLNGDQEVSNLSEEEELDLISALETLEHHQVRPYLNQVLKPLTSKKLSARKLFKEIIEREADLRLKKQEDSDTPGKSKDQLIKEVQKEWKPYFNFTLKWLSSPELRNKPLKTAFMAQQDSTFDLGEAGEDALVEVYCALTAVLLADGIDRFTTESIQNLLKDIEPIFYNTALRLVSNISDKVIVRTLKAAQKTSVSSTVTKSIKTLNDVIEASQAAERSQEKAKQDLSCPIPTGFSIDFSQALDRKKNESVQDYFKRSLEAQITPSLPPTQNEKDTATLSRWYKGLQQETFKAARGCIKDCTGFGMVLHIMDALEEKNLVNKETKPYVQKALCFALPHYIFERELQEQLHGLGVTSNSQEFANGVQKNWVKSNLIPEIRKIIIREPQESDTLQDLANDIDEMARMIQFPPEVKSLLDEARSLALGIVNLSGTNIIGSISKNSTLRELADDAKKSIINSVIDLALSEILTDQIMEFLKEEKGKEILFNNLLPVAEAQMIQIFCGIIFDSRKNELTDVLLPILKKINFSSPEKLKDGTFKFDEAYEEELKKNIENVITAKDPEVIAVMSQLETLLKESAKEGNKAQGYAQQLNSETKEKILFPVIVEKLAQIAMADFSLSQTELTNKWDDNSTDRLKQALNHEVVIEREKANNLLAEKEWRRLMELAISGTGAFGEQQNVINSAVPFVQDALVPAIMQGVHHYQKDHKMIVQLITESIAEAFLDEKKKNIKDKPIFKILEKKDPEETPEQPSLEEKTKVISSVVFDIINYQVDCLAGKFAQSYIPTSWLRGKVKAWASSLSVGRFLQGNPDRIHNVIIKVIRTIFSSERRDISLYSVLVASVANSVLNELSASASQMDEEDAKKLNSKKEDYQTPRLGNSSGSDVLERELENRLKTSKKNQSDEEEEDVDGLDDQEIVDGLNKEDVDLDFSDSDEDDSDDDSDYFLPEENLPLSSTNNLDNNSPTAPVPTLLPSSTSEASAANLQVVTSNINPPWFAINGLTPMKLLGKLLDNGLSTGLTICNNPNKAYQSTISYVAYGSESLYSASVTIFSGVTTILSGTANALQAPLDWLTSPIEGYASIATSGFPPGLETTGQQLKSLENDSETTSLLPIRIHGRALVVHGNKKDATKTSTTTWNPSSCLPSNLPSLEVGKESPFDLSDIDLSPISKDFKVIEVDDEGNEIIDSQAGVEPVQEEDPKITTHIHTFTRGGRTIKIKIEEKKSDGSWSSWFGSFFTSTTKAEYVTEYAKQ